MSWRHFTTNHNIYSKMIRKIFKRIFGTRIRKAILARSRYPMSDEDRNVFYDWVTGAPVWEWMTRLWCIRQYNDLYHVKAEALTGMHRWITGKRC